MLISRLCGTLGGRAIVIMTACAGGIVATACGLDQGHDTPHPASAPGATAFLQSSQGAEALIASLRARYSEPAGEKAPAGGGRPAALAPGRGPSFPESIASGLVRAAGRIAAKFAALDRPPVDVSFGERADSAFDLVDRASGLHVSARLSGAGSAKGEAARGYLVYRGAIGGTSDLVHVPTPTGTEDWVTVPGPELSSISYEIGLGEKVAGVRLFANTLELLDATGMPRLRVNPPYLIDAAHAYHEAELAVRGCAYDASAAPPWSHEVQPPGSESCEVTVRWNPSDLAYPAVLDPPWTNTGAMGQPGRYGYAAGRLSDGTVLVAGGIIGSGLNLTALDTAERFTLDSGGNGVWAAAARMKGGARGAPFGVVKLNRLYVFGGTADFCTSKNDGEYFNAATNDWAPVSMPASDPPLGRSYDATATLLPDGRVLLVGGTSSTDCTTFSPQVRTDIYNTNDDSWARGPDLPTARANHQAVLIPGPSVLVAGGQSVPDPDPRTNTVIPYLASTVLFNPSTNQWTAGPTMAHGRRWFGLVSLSDAKVDVLAFGGPVDSTPNGTAEFGTSERWDGGAAWASALTMRTPREWIYGIGATRLPDGSALAVLGNATFGSTAVDGEVFDPGTGTWTSTGPLPGGQRTGQFVVTPVGNPGNVIVPGGQAPNGGPVAATDLYTTTPVTVDAGPDGATLVDAAAEAEAGTGGGIEAGTGADATPDVRPDSAPAPEAGSEGGIAPDARPDAPPAVDASGDTTVADASGDTTVTDGARMDAKASDGATTRDGASGGDAGPEDDGSMAENTPASEDSGCSCRVGTRSNASSGWGALLALGAAALLRGRRRRAG